MESAQKGSKGNGLKILTGSLKEKYRLKKFVRRKAMQSLLETVLFSGKSQRENLCMLPGIS